LIGLVVDAEEVGTDVVDMYVNTVGLSVVGLLVLGF
jgi:hypothetical protein